MRPDDLALPQIDTVRLDHAGAVNLLVPLRIERRNDEVTLLCDEKMAPRVPELLARLRPGARLVTGPEAEDELIFLDGGGAAGIL